MKNPAKKTYIKRGIWYLGGRKKQKTLLTIKNSWEGTKRT